MKYISCLVVPNNHRNKLLKKKKYTTQQINRIFVEVEIVHPWKHDALLLQTNTGARN